MTNTTTMPGKPSAAVSSGASAATAPTQFIQTRLEKYAYHRFGGGASPPLLFPQHFTGTLDNWELAAWESGGVVPRFAHDPVTV